MIVLDTNVLSEFMRSAPNTHVVSWLDSIPPDSLWTTAITVYEIRFGLGSLPEGRRRLSLEAAFEAAIRQDLEGRILSFDQAAADAAGAIAAARRRAGRPVDVRDVQIAGIVSGRRAVLATRNVRDFEGIGIGIVDPWAAG